MNWNDHLPALLIAVPLLGAFLAPVVSLFGRVMRNLLLTGFTFITLLVALLLWQRVYAGGAAIYVMGGESFNLALPSGMALPIRIILEVDAFGAFMAVCGTIAAFAGALFSTNYMEKFTGLGRFVALYFLLVAGMLGMMATGDLFNFFIFLEQRPWPPSV